MENTTPKPYIFVVMPFAKEFDEIYESAIKPACENAGAYCERVDEQIFEEDILDWIYIQISKSDIIVGDMSQRNSNVFYEIGYAHALNKRVILLTQNANDIPFDLKHRPHIIYEGKTSLLKEQLEKRIRYCIDNPNDPLGAKIHGFPQLQGRWESIWHIQKEDGSINKHTETLYIDKQDGNRIKGYITSDEPDQVGLVCNFEGFYNEGFLQLLWYPAPEVRSRDIIDYGCYFFKHEPDGTYHGYALGYYWNTARIDTYKHVLTRISE